MDATILLVALLGLPVILLMMLRINASMIFLSLCLGAVLVQFVGPDAATIVSSAKAHPVGMRGSQSTVNLILQLLPVVLTAILMIRTVSGKTRLAYNILPAIGVSALLALLTVPLLPPPLTGPITFTPLWRELENLQTLLITASTLLALFFLWLQRPKNHVDKHHKH